MSVCHFMSSSANCFTNSQSQIPNFHEFFNQSELPLLFYLQYDWLKNWWKFETVDWKFVKPCGEQLNSHNLVEYVKNWFCRRLPEFIVLVASFCLKYGVSIFFHSFHIRVVQATVSSAGVDTSDTRKLLETILVQLRPVVLNEVRNALRTSTYPLDAQSLTIRIIKNLRPFVAEALKKELAKRPAPTPAPAPIPAPSGGLSSIFGNGENFVKVESPDINYNYEFNAPLTRK